jgi:hypothetical protein
MTHKPSGRHKEHKEQNKEYQQGQTTARQNNKQHETCMRGNMDIYGTTYGLRADPWTPKSPMWEGVKIAHEQPEGREEGRKNVRQRRTKVQNTVTAPQKQGKRSHTTNPTACPQIEAHIKDNRITAGCTWDNNKNEEVDDGQLSIKKCDRQQSKFRPIKNRQQSNFRPMKNR